MTRSWLIGPCNFAAGAVISRTVYPWPLMALGLTAVVGLTWLVMWANMPRTWAEAP